LEILGFIGKGGMGAVYKARQKELDRVVALKILPPGISDAPGFAERFTREAKALAKLSHPGIVTIHDFGRVDGLFYFVMEFVDGMNLRQLMAGGRVSSREALAIVPEICDALQFAHDHGIVHRDIKPANVLIDRRGRVKVADFGLAKLVEDGAEAAALAAEPNADADPALTEPGKLMGTPSYMAPEQKSRPEEVDHRADIYALGVVFYELLTGELPGPRLQPPSRKVHIDVRLDEIVLRALEKEPAFRYQQAKQVKSDVETVSHNPDAGTPTNEDEDRLTGDALGRDYSPSIAHCLRRGWALVRGDFWPLVGITALSVVLMGLAGSVGKAIDNSSGDHDSSTISGIVYLLLKGPLAAGVQLYFLHRIRGRRATVETAFSGFTKQRYLHLFLAGFVTTWLTTLGYFLFILPGIYLTIAWTFTLALVIDKQLHFWAAMELSRKAATRHWWMFFAFAIVLTLFKLAGLVAFLVGFFVTLPIAVAALMYAYEDLFGARDDATAGVAPIVPATSLTKRHGWFAVGVALLAVLVVMFVSQCQDEPRRNRAGGAAANREERQVLAAQHQWLEGVWAFDVERTKEYARVAASSTTDPAQKAIFEALSKADFAENQGMTWTITAEEMQSNHPQSGIRKGPYRILRARDANSIEIETMDEGKPLRMLFQRDGDRLQISMLKRDRREGPLDLPGFYKKVQPVERLR
ncbi:MAG TPA: protein kinase, partial [Chthoniobacteraceae bacterium]|nr:protein kinase [Chthoniobacteraceae bacterium]